MGRATYDITDENQQRLKLLKAFASINDGDVTIGGMVNAAIEQYYVRAYQSYTNGEHNDSMRSVLEQRLPKD